jgi:hypothetical protein
MGKKRRAAQDGFARKKLRSFPDNFSQIAACPQRDPLHLRQNFVDTEARRFLPRREVFERLHELRHQRLSWRD